MSTWVKIVGGLLLGASLILAVALTWAAKKGFLGSSRLVIDLPRHGHVWPIPVGAVAAILVLTALVGVMILLVGRR